MTDYAIELQIDRLESELDELRHQLELRQPRPAAPAAPGPAPSRRPDPPGCPCPIARRRWQLGGTCATCGQRPTERQLEPVIYQALCGGTGLVLWRNQSGHATYQGRDGATYHVDYGVGNPPGGGGDYVGIWTPGAGRWVEVEMKTGSGRLSGKQRARAKLITQLRGVYAVVRSVDHARALLAWLQHGGERPGFVFAGDGA